MRNAIRSLPRPVLEPLLNVYFAARRLTWPLRGPMTMPQPPRVHEAPVRFLVGPANQAGQGWAWARAAERTLTGVAAQVFSVRRNDFGYDSDYVVTTAQYRDPRWQREQERYVTRQFSHVLIEALRPVFGNRYGSDCRGDVDVLTRRGVAPALVAHGSELRMPSRHAAHQRWSPFAAPDDLTERLERQARRNAAIVRDFAGPMFVSTPDLLLDAPRAQWLPVVVEPERWATDTPVLVRSRPVVLHVPSNAWLKGTAHIERAMERLGASGLIEYRRIEHVANERLPEFVADADIVVDQLLMGLYGVAACEAMAAGRVVVGHVGSDVRDHVQRETGRAIPIVEADPDTLTGVVRELVNERGRGKTAAAEGVSFVKEIHDGRMSGRVLARWLGRPPA
jgi:hypothetical protein